jgi:hypothetical protein
MTHHYSSHRHYRLRPQSGSGEYCFQVVAEETDLWITAEADCRAQVQDLAHALRGQVKNALTLFPKFGPSLSPITVPKSAPDLIQEMVQAAAAWGVGPMASVAGAIANAIADRCAQGQDNILVENGGDIYAYSSRPRSIGLLSQPEKGLRLGLQLGPQDFPCALCASSGRIGHSLSLGRGDLVVVRAERAAFADAGATALANMLHTGQDVQRVLDLAQEMACQGVQGVFAQYGEKIGIWGEMEIVEVESA